MQTYLNRDFKDFFNYKHYNRWKHLHSFRVAESYVVVYYAELNFPTLFGFFGFFGFLAVGV